MATLNVKNVPERLHRKLKARARRELRSVSQEVIRILSEAVDEPSPTSILELRGLGKRVWKRVDPTDHVRRERDTWN
ncbi:MAG: FitA-like ribbon-helix-helix domain-containing protein [Candidatus Binatia bacterium]